MKKLTIIPIVLAMVLLLSAAAFAASVSYSPAFTAKEATAGDAVQIPLGVMVRDLASPALVKFVDSVENGNLPASWLAAGPEMAPVDPMMPFAESTLLVHVPADAAPGTYNGFVKSSVEGAEGGADPGRGAYIQVTVLPASSCDKAPKLVITGIDPQSISVPNNKDVDITVSGTVENGDGCEALAVSFSLDDEYGKISASGPATMDGNAFAATVTVSASRKGSDKDGRTYQISISAENEAEVANASVNVTVGHDNGKRSGGK